jgi:soluble lytic murein transglycosylase-like protein
VRPRKGRVPFQSADILPHLIQQESGGRVGISGPQTQYGQAQGITQMLPATAQGVAKKLGVPWRPDLMSGKSEAAAAYQKALGQGYLEESLNATGNVRDGLMRYHGGPNRRLWGPKTNSYADNILRRMGV